VGLVKSEIVRNDSKVIDKTQLIKKVAQEKDEKLTQKEGKMVLKKL